MILAHPDPATDPYFADVLLGVQLDAYAVEARIIADERIPRLHDDRRTLTGWRGHWLVAWDGAHLVGATGWTETDSLVDIDRLMVAPAAHRQGIGSTLLSEVVATAEGRAVHVSTGRDNTPALGLYRRFGFEPVDDAEVQPGLWVRHLRRE